MPPILPLHSHLAIYIMRDVETCDNSNVITQYTKRPPSSTGLAGMDGRASVVILWCLGMTAVMTRLGPVGNVHHIRLTKAHSALPKRLC